MASKRMIAKEILESDEFTSMSADARLLYIYMTVYADDDGIVDNPRNLVRMVQAADGDVKQLIENNLILPLGGKVLVVRDFLRFNRVQPSRYRPSVYVQEREMLVVTNGRYLCQHNVDILSRSIDKNSIDKNSIDKHAPENLSIDEWRTEIFQKQKIKNTKNMFNQFEQNIYDFDNLEKKLLDKHEREV